jgi:flagellar assembly protein FliH
MTRTPFLESFDDVSEVAAPETTGPTEDWLAGHSAGHAEAMAAAAQDTDRLAGALAERIADLSFTFADAEQIMLSRLRALFDTLVTRVLPEVPQTGLAAHIAAQLEAAAAEDMSGPVTIRVEPAQVAPVTRALTGVAGNRFEVRPDPALGPGEAILSTDTRETALDLAQLTSDLGAALSCVVPPSKEGTSHG